MGLERQTEYSYVLVLHRLNHGRDLVHDAVGQAVVHFPGRAQHFQRDAFAACQFGQRLHVRLGEQAAHSGAGLQATRRNFLVEAERQREADRIGVHVLAQAARVH